MLSLCIVCFKQNNKVKPQGGRKLNKIEISNLPDKEFKVVVIKMISELRMDEHGENFSKEIKT